MTPDGFVPFVPRVVVVRTHAQAPPVDPESSAVTEEPASVAPTASLEGVLTAPDTIDRDAGVKPHDGEPRCCDETASAASVREHAIRFAGEACARALHEAIARNPLFVARFVDDAIEAAGRGSSTTVRLSPVDAPACRGRQGLSVVADEDVRRGEVVVETAHGTVKATVEQRAQLLVRAVADS